ncbi:MAG: polysaccharide biosynthesis protein, partial [Clostridia bacterium]|nr:polysaccharide biosynthesis protein [Clostridia bacterium]
MNTTAANQRSNKIINGVVILTVANIIVKIIGFAYKIPLLKVLGENGMAYYNAAYQIYTWFYTLSTAGLPLAVAKLVAWSRAEGNKKQGTKTLNVALLIFGSVGIFGSAAMFFFARSLSSFQNNPEAYRSIMMLAPTLFFICLTSALRGYFQGHENMMPTAISEVIEAASKLALGIVLALYAKNSGLSLSYQAAYAIFGVSMGAVLSTLYLFIVKKFFKYDKSTGVSVERESTLCSSSIAKSLLNIAIPISLSSSVMSVASLIDSFVMIGALKSIGYDSTVAEGIFGNYTTQCVTMYNLPTVLVLPIAVGIVPYLTQMLQKNDREGFKNIAVSSMKMTNLIALPCALGLSSLSYPILKMIFHNDTDRIAPMLSVLSIAIIFVGIVTVTNVILQTHNKQYMTLISIGCGTLSKLLCALLLTGVGGRETLGVLGTPTSTVVCYFVAAMMNILFVIKYTGVVPKFTTVY